MKKVIITMLLLSFVASMAMALPGICYGTALNQFGVSLGAGWTATVYGHSTCYGVTDANSYFEVTGSPIPDIGYHYLKFTKTGSRTLYSPVFYYNQTAYNFGTVTLQISPPGIPND